MFPERLTQGYRAFLSDRFAAERSRYETLAKTGQRPEIMVVGCVDSRVSPEVIFDAAPGELMVVRNVANLVPPYEPDAGVHHGVSAALEFAVMVLNIEHIVVMGHAGCGGVSAFARGRLAGYEPISPGDFVGKWIRLIDDAAKHVEEPQPSFDHYVEQLALASVVQSIRNLRRFPWIEEREKQGKLQLYGAYFGIATGTLLALDRSTGRFEMLR